MKRSITQVHQSDSMDDRPTKKPRLDTTNYWDSFPVELFVKVLMLIPPNIILIFQQTSKKNKEFVKNFIRQYGRKYYERVRLPDKTKNALTMAATTCTFPLLRAVYATAVWERSEVKDASNAATDKKRWEHAEFLNYLLDTVY